MYNTWGDPKVNKNGSAMGGVCIERIFAVRYALRNSSEDQCTQCFSKMRVVTEHFFFFFVKAFFLAPFYFKMYVK